MSDHEPVDDRLRAALRRRAAGDALSTAAAHDAVLRRAGTIRRRRAAIGGAGAMTVLALGGIMLLPGASDETAPAVTGDVLPSFEEPTTTLAAGPVDTVETVDGATPVTVDRPTPQTTSPSPTPTPTPSSSSSPSSLPDTPSTAPTSSIPSTSAAPTSPPPSSAPATSVPTLAPFTDTYESTGGSLTVTWNGAALVLQAVVPAPGYTAEVEDISATRVRIGFEGESGDSRIEVRVSDGQVVVDID